MPSTEEHNTISRVQETRIGDKQRAIWPGVLLQQKQHETPGPPL